MHLGDSNSSTSSSTYIDATTLSIELNPPKIDILKKHHQQVEEKNYKIRSNMENELENQAIPKY